MEPDGGSHPREGEGHSESVCARIIVVGGPVLAEQVIAATHRPVMVVATFYDAIGELSWADPQRGRIAIVGDVDRIRGEAQAFASSIRAMTVQTLLIAVHDGDDEPKATQAVERGFDAALAMPITGHALASLIGASEEQDSDGDHIDDHTSASQGRETKPIQPQSIQPPASPSQASDRPAPRPVPDLTPPPPRPTEAGPAPSSPAPTGSVPMRGHAERGGSVSDSDLIDRLLTNPANFRPTTLQIVASETGVTDLRFVDEPESDGVCLPISYRGQTLTYLASGDATDDALTPWLDWLSHWLQLERQMARLRRMAFTDQMTGAWNRRYFDSFLPAIIKQARRDRHCVSLMLFDIDDFKYYNDAFGHAAGDEILIETVRLLKSVIRPGDRVCRIGGDEFAVIFYDPTGKRVAGSQHPLRAEAVARRFQEQIAAQRFPKLGSDARGRLTISGGIATYPWDGQDPESLIEYADQAAMTAKRAGKNAIVYGNGDGEHD